MSKLRIISHAFNEEKLLPAWLLRHVPLADQIIIVDDHSTDCSRDVIEHLAPRAYIIDSQRQYFNAAALDREIMEIEERFYEPDIFTIVLNVTEFLMDVDIKQKLEEAVEAFPSIQAFGMRSYVMVGNGHCGFLDSNQSVRRHRYAHKAVHGHYQLGRHACNLPSIHLNNLYIQWQGWNPWPEVKERKLQIKSRLDPAEPTCFGIEHRWSEEEMDLKYQEMESRSYDLMTDPNYSDRIGKL